MHAALFLWVWLALVFVLPVQASEAYRSLFQQIDGFVAHEAAAAQIPATAIALTQGGKVVFQKGYGFARPGVATGPDTPFFIGSLSKGLTAMGLMTLVEAGKVTLRTPVHQCLPDFAMADPRFTHITVEHLLLHRSGIPAENSDYEHQRGPLRKAIQALRHAKLYCQPGTYSQYANWNYILVGAIIEAVSGQSYGDFMEAQVFAPMGMVHSYASVEAIARSGVAQGARTFLSVNLPKDLPYPPGAIPAGYLVSTAHDMAQYLATLQSKGITPQGNRVLSPESVRALGSPLPPTSPYHHSYGYGWVRKHRAISHKGDIPNFHAAVHIEHMKTGDWGIVLLCAKNEFILRRLFPEQAFQHRLLYGMKHILARGAPYLCLPAPHWPKAWLFLGALVCLGLAFYSLWEYRQGRREPKPARWRHILGTLQVGVPGMVMVGFPLVSRSPGWRHLWLFMPDITCLVGGLALMQLGIGLLKALDRWRTHKRSHCP